jgi:hypothetical protein
MIRADEEFWDVERASYDDELDSWRERTAYVPVPADVATRTRRAIHRLPARRDRPTQVIGRPAQTRIRRTAARRQMTRARG